MAENQALDLRDMEWMLYHKATWDTKATVIPDDNRIWKINLPPLSLDGMELKEVDLNPGATFPRSTEFLCIFNISVLSTVGMLEDYVP